MPFGRSVHSIKISKSSKKFLQSVSSSFFNVKLVKSAEFEVARLFFCLLAEKKITVKPFLFAVEFEDKEYFGFRKKYKVSQFLFY